MNRVVLTGSLAERGILRYTPAGLPALDLRLTHASEVVEAGAVRKIAFEIRALALGELAGQAAQLAVGEAIQVEGFLGPAFRGAGVRLHVTGFQPMSSPPIRSKVQE
ncbi:primosomal replication protein N [Aquariibacter albus]|uniref:Replication restart protein PriB n=1 Tax=Aquariibacter albus TaxID=2759899 RepID=A0A839HHL5_9BURK|nr:primosomal replication protein N [Aquariibacter albus]MBB1161273.1 primosomal replication protein N [Aquariibacter albus]